MTTGPTAPVPEQKSASDRSSQGWVSGIKRILRPPVFPGDEEKTRRAAIMNMLLLATLGTQLMLPLFWVYGTPANALIMPAWLADAVVGLVLLRLGYVRAACVLAIIVGWVLINVIVVTSEGIVSPAFSSHLVIAGCAGLVLGWRAMLASILAAIAFGFALVQLQARGILHPEQHQNPLLMGWMTYAVIFLVATVLLVLVVSNLNQALVKTKLELEQRNRAERALMESEIRYRTLFEALPIALLVMDCDTERFIDANQAAESLFGMSRAQLMNTGPIDLSPPRQPDGGDSRELAEKHIRATLDKGKAQLFEWIHRNSTGREIHCEVNLVRLPSDSRRLIEASIADVTERKRLEARVLHAQKMESVGLLAGGVAHDFNNLLSVIISSVELLDMKLIDPSLKAQTADVRRAAIRASQLTRQLLAFSRKQVLQPAVLNVNTIINELDKMLRRLLGAQIEVTVDLAENPWLVKADRGQLEQVILNLVVNARDAMPKGGTLRIATRNVDVEPHANTATSDGAARKHLDSHSINGVTPGRYVVLEVADTGCGMDAATLSRLFEPFFTTKEVGQGTGLGLSTAHGIVKQSGGHICVDSEMGKGSTFCVYLPRTESQEPIRAPVIETPDSPRGTETILIAEDNLLALNVAAQSLEAFGYKVLRAESPDVALQLAQTYEGSIHMLLTDVIMPNMNGRQLADAVCAFRPQIGLLFMSGYTRDVMMNQGVLEEGLALIEKPFTPESLARRVRSILDAASKRS